MRPHDVLESMGYLAALMAKYQVPEGQKPNPDMWETARGLLTSAATFDFRASIATDEHFAFGIELMMRGAFRLPFACVFYTSGNPKGFGSAATLDASGQLWVAACTEQPSDFARNRQLTKAGRLPIALACVRVENATLMGDVEVVALTEDDTQSRAWGYKAVWEIFGRTVMLMSKDVETTYAGAPDRLNKARLKKGLPPIGASHTVTIRREAHPGALCGAGSHSSPVIHWRRGHFRTLRHQKYGGERIIPVAPSLVGANDESRSIVPKDYVFRVEP